MVGADRAARALLVQLPGAHADFWSAWARVLLRALLETAALSGGPGRRGSMVFVDEWVMGLLDGDLARPGHVLARFGVADSIADVRVAELVADAARGFGAFDQAVTRWGDRRCTQAVAVVVDRAVASFRHPPPGITCGEWFAARWQAADRSDRDEVSLWELVAVERDGRSPQSQHGCRAAGVGGGELATGAAAERGGVAVVARM